MNTPLLDLFSGLRAQRRKGFAILIDPDKVDASRMLTLIALAETHEVSCFFVGGSLVHSAYIQELVPFIKAHTDIPVVLFPASLLQVSPSADAILLLSLISGRNPDLLIGKQVEAAPIIKGAGLEVLPTGYLLIDGGNTTTALYMSNTRPIPYEKDDIAACTAMAGEMLGLKLMYLDGGSGATHPVSPSMIRRVRKHCDTPLIIGGGIRSVEAARERWEAGADLIVVGNAIEEDPEGSLIQALSHTLKRLNTEVVNH